MITNMSREGVGIVHGQPLDCKYFALELRPNKDAPIQIIVRDIRQRQLNDQFREIGVEFFARLGSPI